MPKLFNTYRILTILVFLIGALVIGVVYYYRDVIFKRITESFTDNTYTHAYLKPIEFKIEANWLKNNEYLRKEKVLLPENYDAVIFASNLNSPSKIEVVDNYVLVTQVNTGSLVVLQDSDFNNSANNYFVLDSGLLKPNGINFYNNNLYIASEDKLWVYKNIKEQIEKNDATKESLVDLPIAGINNLKNVVVNKTGIFVSIGSTCDKCIEQNKKRGSVVLYSSENLTEEIYSSGLRDIQDMIEIGPSVVISELGTSGLNNEINVLRKGGFYGWPFFSAKNESTGFGDPGDLVPIGSEFEFSSKDLPKGLEYIENENTSALYVVLSGLSKVSKIAFFESQSSFDDFFILPAIKGNSKPALNDIKRFRNGFLISDSNRGLIYFVYPK